MLQALVRPFGQARHAQPQEMQPDCGRSQQNTSACTAELLAELATLVDDNGNPEEVALKMSKMGMHGSV